MADDVAVTVKQLKPIDVWREADVMVKREIDSRNFWAGIENDERAAIRLVVKDQFLRLLEDPDVWLPTSLDPSKGDRLDVTITIMLPALNPGELSRRVSAERIVAHTTDQLIALEKELRDP